jgi:hypothetical protein
MPSFRLHSHRDVLSGLVASFTLTTAVLGGCMLMFGEAGRAPWFEPGSELAREAERCGREAGAQARHQCLRQVAADAQRRAESTLLASRKASASAR